MAGVLPHVAYAGPDTQHMINPPLKWIGSNAKWPSVRFGNKRRSLFLVIDGFFCTHHLLLIFFAENRLQHCDEPLELFFPKAQPFDSARISVRSELALS